MAFILGAKDQSSSLPKFIFQTSLTWACPVAMEAIVYVIGAGGSGGHVGYSQKSLKTCNAGGAGGCAISRLSLSAQNYTVTIGSGGARTDGNNNGSAGSAGGNSVFSGTGIDTMTGNGGSAGNYGGGVSAVTGGSASGGNILNNTGGGSPPAPNLNNIGGGGGVNFGTAASQVDGMGSLAMLGSNTATDYVPGGSMRGTLATGHAGEQYHLDKTNGYDGRNAMLGFDLFNIRMQHGFEDFTNNDIQTTSGVMGGDKRQFFYYNSSSQVTLAQAPPFEGGFSAVASYGNSTTVRGSAGGVGAGGGAFTSTANGGTAYSGPGGSGLVMIFPITMG